VEEGFGGFGVWCSAVSILLDRLKGCLGRLSLHMDEWRLCRFANETYTFTCNVLCKGDLCYTQTVPIFLETAETNCRRSCLGVSLDEKQS
jgi:hypothetical protein